MFIRKIYLPLSFFFLLNLPFFTSKAQSHSTVISKLSEGLGNITSINSARFIMFSSVLNNDDLLQGEHTYLYDSQTKECRFEGETKDRKQLTVLFNAQTNVGEVYLDKKKTDTPELLKIITRLFSKESYFLFTPMLLATNKVPSTTQESEIIDSKRYFVLKVNASASEFEYSKLYIDSQTGIINRWETFDRSKKKTQDLLISKTKDVGGGLTLATKFTDKITGKGFQYPIVAALLNIEPEKFKTP